MRTTYLKAEDYLMSEVPTSIALLGARNRWTVILVDAEQIERHSLLDAI
jgi:hypothetical protein